MIPHSRLRPHLLTTALGLFSATTLPAATLRVLPVTNSESFAYGLGLSSGGSVAGFIADLEASLVPTLWSKTSAGYGAPLSLPLLPGGAGGEVRWISANGALAAGYVDLPTSDFSLNLAPVLWSRDTAGNYGVTGLPRLAGSPAAGIVAAASSTGARLAGVDGDSEAATVWRGSPGASYVAQALPLPSGAGHPSFATAASSDGAWLAGRVTTTTTAAQQAVVWSEANGIYSARALQVPAGSTETLAEAISADGTLIAGTSDNAGIYVATKWDARTGQATRLESRADADTAALAVSSDKLWIGGRATDILDYTDEAMLWDAQGKAATLASLAPDINFGSFVPGEIRAITLVSPGVYTLVGTGATLGTGQTQAFVIENLSLQTSGSGVTTPTTTTPDTGTPTTSTPGTTTPTTGTPTTSTPTTGTSGTGSTGTDSTSLTPGFDPASSTSRTLVGDTFSAIFDPTRATQWRFAGDQAALRPLRVTFPGTSRDALSFDGTRMLPGPLAQDLFAPGVAQDMAFVGAIRIPATGGSGKAILFAINHSAAEPAIALGYDYSQSRFYAVYLQAFNGAPSEIAGPASPRDASYVVRLQKTGGALGLYVNGTLVAQTNSARPAILNAGQGAPLGLGGIRPLNPQFVGQLGKFHLRNTALSAAKPPRWKPICAALGCLAAPPQPRRPPPRPPRRLRPQPLRRPPRRPAPPRPPASRPSRASSIPPLPARAPSSTTPTPRSTIPLAPPGVSRPIRPPSARSASRSRAPRAIP